MSKDIVMAIRKSICGVLFGCFLGIQSLLVSFVNALLLLSLQMGEGSDMGDTLLPDPPEDDNDSLLDLESQMSNPKQQLPSMNCPSSPSPPSPFTPNVSVALKEITSLLNIVVKRMDHVKK